MEEGGFDFKVVVLGATDVGKTSLTIRYVEGNFAPATAATIGASFLQKRIVQDGQIVTLQIWDTAGQERALYGASASAAFNCWLFITTPPTYCYSVPMFYRNAHAAIFVFDLTKEGSFEKMQEFHGELVKHAGSDTVLAIAGNKSDMSGADKCDFSRVEKYASKIGAFVGKTSAKSGDGVEALFESVLSQLISSFVRPAHSRLHTDESEFSGIDGPTPSSTGGGNRRGSDPGRVNLGPSGARDRTARSSCC